MKTRNWIIAVIGVWLVVSPWALRIPERSVVATASVIAGVIQVLVAIWAAMRVDVPRWNLWQNWVTVLTGFWFVVQPFLGEYDEFDYYLTLGPAIITMALSLWNLMAPPRERPTDGGSKART